MISPNTAKNRVELDYFHIGNALGGSQSWMRDPWMRLGGCAALAAVDSCIYFTLFNGKKLCPINVHHLTKDSYIRFASTMKPYIPPRFSGVSKLELYIEGMEAYLHDRGCEEPFMQPYPTGQPLEDAQRVLQQQIDRGFPIPFLLLNPISRVWKEYYWHWFLLIGYRWDDSVLMVKAVTYGEGEWLPFSQLWDSVRHDNGGMILYISSDSLLPPDCPRHTSCAASVSQSYR